METITSFRFGKNLLTVTPETIILKKTRRSKAILIFWTGLMLIIIGGAIIYLMTLNRAHLHLPGGFFDRLLSIAALAGILYFIFNTVRQTVDECKTYVFDSKQSQLLANGTRLGELAKAEFVIIKSVGWEGLG